MSNTNPTDAETAPEDAAREGRQPNRIPGHKVESNVSTLPHAQAKAILWLHSHYYESRASLAQIGAEIGYDAATVSKLFHGHYGHDLEAVTESIERFRLVVTAKVSGHEIPFIETGLSREIEECVTVAATYQSIVFIYGEAQIGKTRALQHIAGKSAGKYCYWEMPVGGALSHAMASLAEVRKVSRGQRAEIMMSEIALTFGPEDVLLIDEAARTSQSRSYGSPMNKTLDFLRWLHDQRHFGIVFSGTKVFREDMENKEMAKFLNQFNRRCMLRRQLDDLPSETDLNAFAAYYRLAPASGEALLLQTQIVGQHGLGVWLKTLLAANRRAKNTKAAMTWGQVITAHTLFKDLEKSKSQAAPVVATIAGGKERAA